jgi:hypothetical protein
MIWDWGFTWKNVVFTNCFVAIDCTAFGSGPNAQGTGSIVLLGIFYPFSLFLFPIFLLFHPPLSPTPFYSRRMLILVPRFADHRNSVRHSREPGISAQPCPGQRPH